MKRILSLLLALVFVFSFAASAFAITPPAGYEQPSASKMKTLCDGLNKDDSQFIFTYDENLGAVVINTFYGENSDPQKSIINLMKSAENGDESAKNTVALWEMMYKRQAESFLETFFELHAYVNVVFRCLDPLADNAIALEYIDGIRTSYRPE